MGQQKKTRRLPGFLMRKALNLRLYFGVTVQEGAGRHGGFTGGLELVNDESAGGAGEEELVIRGDEGDAGGEIGG